MPEPRTVSERLRVNGHRPASSAPTGIAWTSVAAACLAACALLCAIALSIWPNDRFDTPVLVLSVVALTAAVLSLREDRP